MKVFKVYLEEKEGFSSEALKEKFDAINWQKFEKELQDFQSDSGDYAPSSTTSETNEQISNISRLLVCSDYRIISAPEKILEYADLVLVSFANEADTFRNLILQKEDSRKYRDILWPGSVDRFLGFEQTFKGLKELNRQKIVFVNDSASIDYFRENGDASSLMASFMIDHVSKFALGVCGDFVEAMACCTQPIPNFSPQQASNRLITIRSEFKVMFAEHAKEAIITLLQSYPKSHKECIAYVLDKVLKNSVQALLMSSEEYKSACQAIITQKLKEYAAEPASALSVANIFSKHSLEFWLMTKEEIYSLKTPHSLRDFINSWKRFQDAGVELKDMDFLAPELRESILHISALRQLCTKLYVVHNFFCIDNPSIFRFVISLLRSRNPLFIDQGFSLLANILSHRSAERFSRYFLDEAQHLSANVAISAFEGLGHLFQPIRDFMQLEDRLKTSERVLEARTYLEKLSGLLSADVWKSLDLLFWGLSQHANLIQPPHVRDILDPLIYGWRYLVANPRDIDTLSVSIIAIMHHILRCGPTSTVEVIMSYSNEIALIACTQIQDEIGRHSCEINMEVSHITNTVQKVLQAILNLLERIGVPSRERTSGTFEDCLNNVEARSEVEIGVRRRVDLGVEKSVQVIHHENKRIKSWYRRDYALLQQLEVEKKAYEMAHLKALQDVRDKCSKLERELELKGDQMSELIMKENDLKARIQMLEKQNQGLMAAATDTRWSERDENIVSWKSLSSNDQTVVDCTVESTKTPTPTDELSSLDLANMLDTGELEASVGQLKGLVALIYRERVNMPKALRPSFCGMLKHLGEDLYTSQAHFMQEMLQNADDTNFKAGESPAVYVFLANRSITVGHNEEGMSARDVLALCSAASSNKVAGTHTGQKGLGFKSVYACTRSPVIISKNWRFQFNADPSTCLDEMAYISPTWLDSDPGDLITIKETLGPKCAELRTMVHLPLKEELTLESLSDGLRSSLNPIALLCAHKLRNIHVYRIGTDKRFNAPSSVSCQTCDLIQMSGDLQLPDGFFVEPNSFKKWRSKLALRETPGEDFFPGLSWDSNGVVEFLTFEARIQYPRQREAVCGERRQRSALPTMIRLLFPRTGLERPQDWPVCATLPVCSVGLPFILQADWDVVTSRENIRMSIWNQCIIDCFISIFELVFRDDAELRGSLSKYLVKVRVEGEMKPFWKDFERRILDIIDQQIPSNYVLATASTDSLKIPDDLVKQCSGMVIVREDSSEVSMEVLEHCRKRFEVEHVLSCFQEEQHSIFSEWAESQGSEWWVRLFEYIVDRFRGSTLDKKKLIQELAKRQPLFLLNHRKDSSSQEVDLSPKRVNLDFARTRVFVCTSLAQQQRYYTWRSEITVLTQKSAPELALLCDVLSFPIADADLITGAIIELHQNSCFDSKNPWGDFVFLASLRSWTTVNPSTDIIHLGKSLCAPTITHGRMPVNACTLVTLMGLRVADPKFVLNLFSEHETVVCVEVVGCKIGLCDAACVEQILICMGSKFPPRGSEPAVQQSLPELAKMSRDDVAACLGLLQLCPVYLQDYLCRCHIALHNSTSAATEEARLTFATSVSAARDLLPSVLVPDFASCLAEKLGVSTKLTFTCSIRAMIALVKRRCLDVAMYTTWLAYAQSFHGLINEAMRLKETFVFADPASLQCSDDIVFSAYCWIMQIHMHAFLVAEVETSLHKLELHYLTVDGLICPEEEGTSNSGSSAGTSSEHISFVAAKLLNKGVVCRTRNGVLSPFAGVLRSMGCKSEPDLADTILSLHSLRLSTDSYIRGGKGILLKPAAIQDVFTLYSHVESLLVRVGVATPSQLREIIFNALPRRNELEVLSASRGALAKPDELALLPDSSDGSQSRQAGLKMNSQPKVVDGAGDLCAAFPLLLSDFSFPVGLHSTEVFQNPLHCIVEAMKDDPIRLLHPKLCEVCPLFCGALGISQLKDRTVTFFRTSLTENIPRSKSAIEKEFNLLLTRKIQLLKVVYIDMLVYVMDKHSLRIHDDRRLSARSDLTDAILLTDSPAHPQAQPNPHLRTITVWAEVPYVIAGDVVFFRPADKTEVAWKLVLFRLLTQLLVSREGLSVSAAEEKARQALRRVSREMLDMRDLEGWRGFESTLHMDSSTVEFPASFAADEGVDDLIDATAESSPSSSHLAPATANSREGSLRVSKLQLPLPSPGDLSFGNIWHADSIFRERLDADKGRTAEGSSEDEVRLKRLNPGAFARKSCGGAAELENAMVDPRAVEWVGLLGERFAALQLQRAYPESFDPSRHWVSSSRLKFYPWARAGVDDAKGYDMEVQDTRGLFVANDGRRIDFGSGKHRRCFVEVKSVAGEFCGAFYLSRNELRVREKCSELGNARRPPAPKPLTLH
jgi:hypothetical protein